MMVEVTVARLGLDSTNDSHVVILREKDGRRLLPIWIGKPEAESIINAMNQIKSPRPNAHDLAKALLIGLGGTLQRVAITRVEKSTYYAELQIESVSGPVQIDARPSDSIAIALRFDAPIVAHESLLTAFDDEDESDDDPSFPVPPPHELSAEQLKAYLANLRPEDFGKFNP